jgi:hypothetical protein
MNNALLGLRRKVGGLLVLMLLVLATVVVITAYFSGKDVLWFAMVAALDAGVAIVARRSLPPVRPHA